MATKLLSAAVASVGFLLPAAPALADGPALFGRVPEAPPTAKAHAPRTFYFQKSPAPEAPANPNILPVSFQPGDNLGDSVGTLKDYGIELEPPTGPRLFRMESERQLRDRVIAEIKSRPVKPGTPAETVVEFPTETPLSTAAYQPRAFNGVIKQIEPQYLCHDRLYFQQLNAERYGWDLGMIQPFICAGEFARDSAMLPYNWATRPCQRFDCSAGYCLPGDPVPYLIYPLERSASGAGAEALTIIALFALIP